MDPSRRAATQLALMTICSVMEAGLGGVERFTYRDSCVSSLPIHDKTHAAPYSSFKLSSNGGGLGHDVTTHERMAAVNRFH